MGETAAISGDGGIRTDQDHMLIHSRYRKVSGLREPAFQRSPVHHKFVSYFRVSLDFLFQRLLGSSTRIAFQSASFA
jgi:hypothetical protein